MQPQGLCGGVGPQLGGPCKRGFGSGLPRATCIGGNGVVAHQGVQGFVAQRVGV